jgi:hypothetical protein
MLLLLCPVCGRQASGIRRAFGFDDASSATADSYDLATQGTLAEATNVLRWERLVGRLAARIAHRKTALLLQWLQLHLAFTEGCSSRGLWLSGKVQCSGCGTADSASRGCSNSLGA